MDIEFVRKRIEYLRTTDGASKRNMSTALEQSESYISNITTGKSIPSLPALFEICDYFGITPKEFFDDGAEPSEKMSRIITGLHALNDDDLAVILHMIDRLRAHQAT